MRDAKPLGVTGEESDAELLRLMAEHPTLLQRPIGVTGTGKDRRAVVGRPPENLLELG
jgi:arsenate reductase-like glutaredoxin family protein